MGHAYQVNAGYYTAAAAGSGTATPMSGDTFNIANFTSGQAHLQNVWVSGASTDWVSIKSARMHDNNQGIRLVSGATLTEPLLPWGSMQQMYSGDTPTVTLDETAAATGAFANIIDYDDLPGSTPRLAMWSDVQPRITNLSGVEVAVSAVAAIGDYSPGVAINSLYDNFKADHDYALLGYVTATSELALVVQGQDTGNLKVGGPGIADPKITYNWFIDMSEGTGKPMIPIIAANNKGSTLVMQTANSAAAAQNVTLMFAELQ